MLRDSGYRVREHAVDVPVAARHVCLLFRRFRNYSGDLTRDYIRALEARRLPHVLSGGRSFHQREEVVAIRSALTAIEWPDDALHVYATLRGRALAGARGNEQARIFCMKLEADLISIAGVYLTADEIPKDKVGKAVQVIMRDGELVLSELK